MKQLEDIKLIASCLSPGPAPRDLTLSLSSSCTFESMKLKTLISFLISTESLQCLAHQLNSLVAGKGCNGS